MHKGWRYGVSEVISIPFSWAAGYYAAEWLTKQQCGDITIPIVGGAVGTIAFIGCKVGVTAAAQYFDKDTLIEKKNEELRQITKSLGFGTLVKVGVICAGYYVCRKYGDFAPKNALIAADLASGAVSSGFRYVRDFVTLRQISSDLESKIKN